jgi:ribosome-associated toxin RatA of RatAB toxin-antitoxin module
MHSTIAIDVAASPDLVFALARDVERWERLLPHYARSKAVEHRADGSLVVDFIARRPLVGVLGLGLPVTWRSRTWNEPATRRLRFVHVAGATRGMDVTWRIEGSGTGAHVAIDHDFQPRLPLFAPFVDRFFTRPIAGRTLATFRALAEALSEPGTPGTSGKSGTSGTSPATDPPL